MLIHNLIIGDFKQNICVELSYLNISNGINHVILT